MATAVSAGQVEVAAPSRWWRSPTVQHDLRLTSEQVRQLDSIFERDLPARIALHRQIVHLDRELLRVIGLEADAAEVIRRIEEVEQLRAQRNVRRTPDVSGNAQGPDTCAANQAARDTTFVRSSHLTGAAIIG